MAEEGAEPRLMDADETMSPVDLPGIEPDDEAGSPLLWTSIVIATVALFLLLANALTIDDWAKGLPPSAATERLTSVTGRWLEITDGVGLGAPRATVHARWKQAEAAQFQEDSEPR